MGYFFSHSYRATNAPVLTATPVASCHLHLLAAAVVVVVRSCLQLTSGGRGRASSASPSSAGRGTPFGPPCPPSWARCGRRSSTPTPRSAGRGATPSESSSAYGEEEEDARCDRSRHRLFVFCRDLIGGGLKRGREERTVEFWVEMFVNRGTRICDSVDFERASGGVVVGPLLLARCCCECRPRAWKTQRLCRVGDLFREIGLASCSFPHLCHPPRPSFVLGPTPGGGVHDCAAAVSSLPYTAKCAELNSTLTYVSSYLPAVSHLSLPRLIGGSFSTPWMS